MKENNKTTTPTTFADLVARYNADPRNADHLTDLATAVAYSVLQKVIDPTRNVNPTSPTDSNGKRKTGSGLSPALIKVRNDLTRDRAYLTRLYYSVNGATRLVFSADGDPVSEIIDPALAKAATALSSQTLGDGLDLVHDAVVALLDETAKQADRDPGQPIDMERPYSVRRLRRKVWIKVAESASGWETVETTPIQEVFKAVRRSIQNSRAMQTDPRSGYTYLTDLAIDPESGDRSTIYRRLPKFADIGGDGTTRPAADYIPGQPAGLDGKPVLYSADRETVETTDQLVSRLNLSDRQVSVLRLRMSGYGYKSIATYLGIDVANVNRTRKQIAAKLEKLGYTDPTEK